MLSEFLGKPWFHASRFPPRPASDRAPSDSRLHWGFMILAALYLLRHGGLLLDDRLYLPHDNLFYHFPSFLYFANSIAHGFGFPRIDFEWGGSEIAITSISMGYFAPHRLIGYLIYGMTSAGPLFVYKLTLLLGFILNAFGWHLIWARTLPKKEFALLGDLLLFCSGIGITILHQEQVLLTLSWLPWALLFLIRAVQTGRGLPLSGACAGGLMTLHYPQIHVVALLILSALFLGLKAFGLGPPCSSGKIRRRSMIAALATFALTITPAIYIMSKKSDYGSPIRGTQDFGASSLEEYTKINELQNSSASIGYLINLGHPTKANDDKMAFFITRVGFWLACMGLIGIFTYYKEWIFLPFFAAAAAWATSGIHGELPQILFRLHVPTIPLFRQWYHFFPYLLISLITMSCLGLATLARIADRRRIPRAVGFIAIGTIALSAGLESSVYYTHYLHRECLHKQQVIPRFPPAEYLALINRGSLHGLVTDWIPGALVAFKEDIVFFGKTCPGALGGHAWTLSTKTRRGLDSPAWCRLLTAAAKPPDGEIVFTPRSIRVRPRKASSRPDVLAVNYKLLRPASGAVSLEPVASSALTLLRFHEEAEIPFVGGIFFLALACQYATVLCAAFAATRSE